MFGGSTADPGPASNGDKKPVDPKRNICGSWKNLDVRDFGSFSSGGVVRPMTSDERYALTIDLSKLPLDNLRDIINTFGLKETGLTGVSVCLFVTCLLSSLLLGWRNRRR